jgi:hypothetical protein
MATTIGRATCMKRVSATSIHALKEALSVVFWYKPDLRSFLQNCISDRLLEAQANWIAYKRQVVSEIVDAMAATQASKPRDNGLIFDTK